MTKADAKRYYPTPALEKGLDILELFASTPEGLTVSEVARRLDRTVSEIFRMILCLEQRGYLAHSTNKERYHLTLRLFRIAQEHPPTKRLVTEAMPAMPQAGTEAASILPSGHHRWRSCRNHRTGGFACIDGLLCEDGLKGRPDARCDRPRHPGAPERGCP